MTNTYLLTIKKSLIRRPIQIFVLLMAFLLLFGIVAGWIFRTAIYENILSMQEYEVKEWSERADDFIETLIDDLKSFYILKDDIAKNDFSLTTTHIYQLFLVNKGIEEVRVVNPVGDEILGVTRVGIAGKESLKNVKDEEYFRAAKSGHIFTGDIYIEGKNVYMDMAVPYFENFKLVAVVWAKTTFDNYFNYLVSESVMDSGHLHILDKNGVILAAADDNYIGKKPGEAFLEAIKDKDSAVGVECHPCVDVHDYNVIVSAQKIKNPLGLFVVLESNKDEIFKLEKYSRSIATASFAALLFFGIVIILIINNRLKKYFNIFVLGINKFHEGKYNEKIVLKSGDELEYVAEHLNHMASLVEENIAKKQEAIDKLRGVDILKYNFITIISHQLRTPVSSIMWLAETLSGQIGGALTKDQRALFQDIHKAARNISQIINDMILMADIDENKVILEKSSANCGDIIGSAIFAAKDQAYEKNVAVEYQKPEITLPDYKGDVKKIKFIFVRLLDNAVKYSEPGKKVVIKSEIRDKELIFSVADNGIGIPQAEQPNIFTKFYRASNAYKMEQDASGLSLCIAKYFIEMHGGKIWFDSKEGEGSTFYFSLPI